MRVDSLEETSRPIGRLVLFCSLDRHLRLSSRGHRKIWAVRGLARQLQQEEHLMTISTHEPQVDHKPVTVTVTVNRHPVTFTERHATGAEIKATAIAQGVPIRQDFTLFLV